MKQIFGLLLGLTSFLGFAQCEDFLVDVYKTDPDCFGTGGIVTAWASGGMEPYDIDIMNSEGSTVNSPGSNTANLLEAGWYYISVVDDIGCEFMDSVEILNPVPIVVESVTIVDHVGPGLCNGSISFEIPCCDLDDLWFIWSPDIVPIGPGITELDGVCPGDYVLTISDMAGCSSFHTFTVGGETTGNAELDLSTSIRVTNSINGCHVFNEIQNAENVSIAIFDVLGNQVLSSALQSGQNTFEIQETGILFYKIIADNTPIQTGKILN